MSSEMQYRIAKAMFEQALERDKVRYEYEFSELSPEAQSEWNEQALAAMTAMREPSFSAQIAGQDAILAEDDSIDLSSDDARVCWEAMLDAEIQAADGTDHD